INGVVKGRMNNLVIPNIEIKTLDRTHLIASAVINGLPDTQKLDVDLNLKKFTTGRVDINRLVAPSMMPDSIQLPHAISLSGTFKGGMSGFDANLSLVTEKGNATVNGNMQLGADTTRSEERRVGKECRCRHSRAPEQKKNRLPRPRV